jgi:hypothetical protein
MINLDDIYKVLLPDRILKKRMEKTFIHEVKDYLSKRYDYEFLYVEGNFAVCIRDKRIGGANDGEV